MKKSGFIKLLLLICNGPAAFSQTVGIGTDFPNAVLEVTSANSGILIPRLPLTATTDIITVPGPIESELVYNSAFSGAGATSVTPGYYYWDGTQWVRLSTAYDHDWYEVGGTNSPDNINDNIYTYGLVGIGTGSPGAPLQVEAFGLGNPSTNSIMAFNSQSSPTDRDAIITARVNGNGDGDPFFTVDILGEAGFSIGLDNSDENKLKISNQWNNLDDGLGSTKMTIQGTNGNVGIGTTTPAFTLEVNGAAGKPGGGSWAVSSDIRLKKEIYPYTEGLATLVRIDPVRFRYNDASGFDGGPEYVGVIAQELQKIAPYMVGSYEKSGGKYLYVDNSAMTYMLINSVKELAGQNEALEERVRLLEEELDRLKAGPERDQ